MQRDGPPGEGRAPAASTCLNPRIGRPNRGCASGRTKPSGNEHLIALSGLPLSVNPVPSYANFSTGQHQTPAGTPVTMTFGARRDSHPNLLISRRVPSPSQSRLSPRSTATRTEIAGRTVLACRAGFLQSLPVLRLPCQIACQIPPKVRGRAAHFSQYGRASRLRWVGAEKAIQSFRRTSPAVDDRLIELDRRDILLTAGMPVTNSGLLERRRSGRPSRH
jgi:hypothetical protein